VTPEGSAGTEKLPKSHQWCDVVVIALMGGWVSSEAGWEGARGLGRSRRL